MKKFIYSNMEVALDVLTDLHERITSTKTKRPTDEIYHPDNMNGSILRIDRGKSFRGHEAQVNISHTGNQLIIFNKYFSGNVSSIFDNNTNTTKLLFKHYYDLPKWMIKKYNDISNYHNLNGAIELEIDNSKIHMDECVVSVERTADIDGLNMFGHKYNIHMLRELQEIGSKFRKQLKKIDIIKMVFDKDNKFVGW